MSTKTGRPEGGGGAVIAWGFAFAIVLLGRAGFHDAWAVDLTVGRLYGSDRVSLIKELAAEYQAKHPNVRITVLDAETNEDLATYEDKVGPLPDVFALAIHLHKRVHELPYCIERDLVAPVEDLASADFVSGSGHFSALWQCIEYQGKHWGVPFYAESYGLLMKRGAMPDDLYENPPASFAELRQAIRETARDDDGDGTPEVWGMSLPPGEELLGNVALLAYQFGENFDLTSKGAISSSEGLKNALGFLNGELQARTMGVLWKQKSAFAIVQSWQFNDRIKRTTSTPPQYWSKTTEYRVAPVPSAGRPGTAPLLNLHLAVKRSTPEREAACFDFIQWATSPTVLAQAAVEKRGFLPVHDEVAESPAFLKKIEEAPHLKVFVDALRETKPMFPFIAYGNQAYLRLGSSLQKSLDGTLTIDAALREGEESVGQVLKVE